ncbi:MAG: hypothetical protein J5I41_11270 [Saprospiraceae bacterium]|nr:hypothetical protein [Saprospiraceae bacterium]
MTTWKERLARYNLLYVTGLLLAIGGCNGVLFLEGPIVPALVVIYFAGLALAWWSGVPLFYRLLALLLPAVVFTSLYTLLRDDRVREPAVWLVPEGYTGPVYVFLKESCGDSARREGEKRLYDIDVSGILLSRDARNYGVEMEPSEWYFVSPDGHRTPIMSSRAPTDTIRNDAAQTRVRAYPGIPAQAETPDGRCYLDYAFIGTHAAYLEFLRGSTLPEKIPSGLLATWKKRKQTCRESRSAADANR